MSETFAKQININYNSEYTDKDPDKLSSSKRRHTPPRTPKEDNEAASFIQLNHLAAAAAAFVDVRPLSLESGGPLMHFHFHFSPPPSFSLLPHCEIPHPRIAIHNLRLAMAYGRGRRTVVSFK